MGRITITLDGAVFDLAPGEAATFGRSPGLGEVAPSALHVGLGPDRSLHAHAGTLTNQDEACLLENTGRWLHLRLQPTDGVDRVDLPPGRSLRVPWPRWELQVATGSSTTGFEVEAEGAGAGAAATAAPLVAGETVAALDLDRRSGYFRALVALCEPLLRDPARGEVATAAQIARALNRLDVEPERVTPKAVERRLAHARRRAGVGGRDPHGVSAVGLEVRDAARQLADLALRTGTVTVRDLELIAPPPDAAGDA